LQSRLKFKEIQRQRQEVGLCFAVDQGLSAPQKSLPTRYLYDTSGSELFEKITQLPEYYLTRCEQSIFEDCAPEIVAAAGENIALVEFGSGSSKKTRLLMEAALERQEELEYVPIDISTEFLRKASETLLRDYPRLSVTALAAEYFDAAEGLPDLDRPRLILFLGSNIGNLTNSEAVDFLARLRKRMTADDRLLVGIDLVKEPSIIEAAYNDGQGVTAEFNKNLLRRLNKELQARFDLDRFTHRAPYLEDEGRVEMRLYSMADQEVLIDAVGKTYTFAEGEFIHTEWSHKYTLGRFEALAGEARLEIAEHWLDVRGWFAAVMLQAS
jgi:L-histidine Nalpha-methyltransferase